MHVIAHNQGLPLAARWIIIVHMVRTQHTDDGEQE